MGLLIDHEKCILCGSCVATCPGGALSIEDRLVLNEEACVLCGVCTDSCPNAALDIVKEIQPASLSQKEDAESDPFSEGGIWVAVQQSEGQALPVAFELIGKGRELADVLKEKLTAVCIGKTGHFAQELIEAGADEVLVCTADWIGDTNDAAYAAVMISLIEKRHPEIVLFGATILGRSAAPRIAASLKTGLTADCTALSIEEENRLLAQTRPALGGNLMATIVCPGSRPQMATVRPGIFPRPEPDRFRTGRILFISPDVKPDTLIEALSLEKRSDASGISDAEVLLVAGRGIGSQKNLKLVKELSALMGARYGVSRPLIDMGWAEYPHQVGQTGASVAPKLLISLGVSGAIQHLAGIGGAKTVIAVNTDEAAPIMKRADYAVCMDCVEFVREMIEKLSCSERQK